MNEKTVGSRSFSIGRLRRHPAACWREEDEAGACEGNSKELGRRRWCSELERCERKGAPGETTRTKVRGEIAGGERREKGGLVIVESRNFRGILWILRMFARVMIFPCWPRCASNVGMGGPLAGKSWG